MSSKSPWTVGGRFFKQSYEGGYRYLDKCGEFMLLAEDRFDFIPNEDVRPTGCTMYLPEAGVEMQLNTVELTLRQMGPGHDEAAFLKLVSEVPSEVKSVIAPKTIIRNGIAVSLFKRLSEEESFKQARGTWGEFEFQIADKIGMNPEFKNIDLVFTSGSYRVNIKLHPSSIRSPSTSIQVAQFQDSRTKREHIQRRNEMNRRSHIEAGHGLVCDIDLMEEMPPVDSLEKHWAELNRITSQILSFLP